MGEVPGLERSQDHPKWAIPGKRIRQMTPRRFFAVLSLVLGGTLLALASTASASHRLDWTEQPGTIFFDQSNGVSADGLGNVYISGVTFGNLGGTNYFNGDAFVSKYDASGTLLWTEQLGTNDLDESYGVSADGLGNVYISGVTLGDLEGTNAGGGDAFVSKYDASGTLLWTEQLGTSGVDLSNGVSADGLGNVYISGFTEGSLEGTNAGGQDAFVSKYDASGTLLWTEQLGTSSFDESRGVSADGLGNVYISGRTRGSLEGTNAGLHDAFVSKYDADGALLWTEQLGTSSVDESYGVSADGLGNVYISGSTEGQLGATNLLSRDAFVSKYDASGTLLWTEQLGTNGGDISFGVSADGSGNVYISGSTSGSFVGTNAGRGDAFVAKFTDLPNLPGDFDGNGFVDGKDFLMWQLDSHLGSLTDWEPNYGTTPIQPGDFDGNGEVNGFDFLLWQRDPSIGLLSHWEANYGTVAALSASLAAVPEPTTSALALAALCLAISRRRAF